MSMESADKFDEPAAVVSGVACPEEMLVAKVHLLLLVVEIERESQRACESRQVGGSATGELRIAGGKGVQGRGEIGDSSWDARKRGSGPAAEGPCPEEFPLKC